jgi:hypothetical protein
VRAAARCDSGVIENRPKGAAVHDYTRKFTVSTVRRKKDDISDVCGRLGFWPFRRTISYHVGVNCDSIAVSGGEILVYRRGRVIATSPMPPAEGFSLSRLLWPRHARKH